MGKLKQAGKKIADQDMFGHTITLNFDKQGDTQNTMVGGVFSIVIRVAMVCYVFLNFKKMLLLEKNSNSSIKDLHEYNNQTYYYKSLDITVFYVLKKQLERGMVWLDRPDLDKYIDIYFEQQFLNWYLPVDGGRYTSKRIKPKQCE